MVKQLSVFLENRHGALVEVTDILSKEKIDIRAVSVADTEDYGILRLIVSDYAKAKEALDQAGFVSAVKDVVAVALNDVPGALSEVIHLLADNGVNIEYIYAFLSSDENKAFTVIRVADNAAAVEILNKAGIEQIDLSLN